ncbi:MAG TPA: tetratricopeptide repeat protein [Chitinophagaceae bacterium]
MKEKPLGKDNSELQEILKRYENLKKGRSNSYIDEESFEKIIDYFDEKEDISSALEAAETGAEQYPFSSTMLIRKADLLIATHKYREALNLLEHAAMLDSSDINVYILKTDAYLALDKQEKAVEILEQALALFTGEERITLLFELADVYDDYQEFEKVFDCLKLILEEEPNNEEALYKICFWTDFTGRNEESIKLHQKIIDEFPYNELAWFNLAAAYQGIKLYEKALDAYQYAIVINEKFDYAYRNMGDAYIRLKKYKEAIEVLQKVLELTKPEALIYEALGFCYDRLHNNGQARFYYRKASHITPEDSKLFYKIACTYFNEGQWESAAKQLETALKLQRHQLEYNLLMGECKMQLGFYKDAIQYFSAIVTTRPKNKKGWEALVRCLYKAEYFEEAKDQVTAALKISNGQPIFLYYLSAVLFALGKTKEAILQLEHAMTKSPKLVKQFVELNPAILQNHHVVDVISRFKRKR